MVNIRSRAHRVLNKLANYRSLKQLSELPPLMRDVNIIDSNLIIGVYVNDPIDYKESVIFCTDSININKGTEWVKISYADIKTSLLPKSKTDVLGLYLILINESEIWVPLKGCAEGRFYDAFEALRFFDRIRDDISK